MAVQISGNDITVPRDGSFTRNVTIGGTLTYEDVTNIDSVGLVTARNGIEIGARPGVAASISVDGNMIVSGISTVGQLISSYGTIVRSVNDNGITIAGGTASNSGANVTVYGGSHGSYPDTVRFRIDGSEKVRIDSSGKFGIGMSSDQQTALKGKLDIDASGIDAAGDTDDPNDYAIVIRNSSSTNSGNGIAFTNDSGAAVGGAIIHIDKGSNNIGDLAFLTSASSNTPVERLRILSTGEVGIGIDAPAKTGIQNNVKVLQIDGGDGAELILGNSTSSNVSVNHIGAIAFKNIDTSTGNAPHYAGIRCNCVDTSGNMNLKFYTGTTNFEADSPDMLIDGTGKVGIGENSPDALLHLSTGASTTCELRLQANNTGSGAGDRGRINVYSALNDGTAYQAGHVDIDRSSGTDDIAHLLVALNDGSSVAERLRITGAGDLKFNSGFGSVATAFGCRAWVYINNTSGNMPLSGNGNVSSVSDLGAGAGRVTFTNAMTDTTYCVVSGLRRQGTHDMLNVNFSNSTGNFRFDSFSNASSSNADLQGYAFAVFR